MNNFTNFKQIYQFLIALNQWYSNYILEAYEQNKLIKYDYGIIWMKNNEIYRSLLGERRREQFHPSCKWYYSINDNIRDIILTLNGIIRFDYDKMKKDNEDFYIELNQVILKPQRIERMSTHYDIDFFEYLDAIM